MAAEVELPSVYLDACIEDLAAAIIGATPTLINLDPESAEIRVPKSSNVQLDIATIDATGTIDLAATRVYVDGVLAFDGGVFQAGYSGGYSNPQADVLRVIIDPDVDFGSQAVVLVRVVSQATGDPGVLDTTYWFSTADTTAPSILSAEAVDLSRIRLVFSESVRQTDSDDVFSATNPANYALARMGDYLTPIASANVASVETDFGALDSVDLITDIPLTPGGTYVLTVEDVEDINGNAVSAPLNEVTFLGWQPPMPVGRDFDLYKRLPGINRREDETLDLFRFVACLQEVANLLLYDIDKFIEILDPDTAPEAFVDLMLADLGNPFDFELTLADKRRLAQVLVDMYLLKGTSVGIENVIRFFLGLEVTVDPYNGSAGTWILGDDELGDTTILGTTASGLLYSFSVTVAQALTDAQRSQLRSIVEYMKPAHTHFVALVEPIIPEILDHMELGLSELGENWYLH